MACPYPRRLNFLSSLPMKIQRLPLAAAEGHVLLHNIIRGDGPPAGGVQRGGARGAGRRVLRKGVRLTAAHLDQLRALGVESVEVALPTANPADPDVWEDEAARQISEALHAEHVGAKKGVGGRVNFFADAPSVFFADAERLLALNRLPGVTLATAPQHAVFPPGLFAAAASTSPRARQVATLKIIPYAIPQSVLDQAVALVSQPAPLWLLRPLFARRAALLVVGDPAGHARLRAQFEPPTRDRLRALGSELVHLAYAAQDEAAVAGATARLSSDYDFLIIVGQTSIMDVDDLIPRALRRAGAAVTVNGAPVDPGNLLVVAFAGNGTPVLCAPGCARSPARNVVDSVLPRLLVGERLSDEEVAALGLGGLLV